MTTRTLAIVTLSALLSSVQQLQPGAITGRVLDGVGPLAGATVTVTGQDFSRTAVTDIRGDYRFDDLRQGFYRVHVEMAPAFTAERAEAIAVESGRTTLHNVELRPAPGSASIRDYRLRSEHGAIVGTIRDTGGGVLSGVTVTALGPGTRRSASTNNYGEYRMSGVPSGLYRLEAAFVGFRRGVPCAVRVGSGQMASCDLTLRHGIWGAKGSNIDYVWPERGIQGALQQSDVVVHVRITAPLGARLLGRDQNILMFEHTAEVIGVVKADLPSVRAGASIGFLQDAAGEVEDEGQRIVGLNEPYAPGQSFIAFLRREGRHLVQSYGPTFTLRVTDAERVQFPSSPVPGESLPGDLRPDMPVDEALAALRKILTAKTPGTN